MSPFKRNGSRPSLPEDQSARYAFVSALLYVVIATVYILLSGRAAAAFAGSLEQLCVIEAYKGVAFAFTTGALFYAISLGFWRKMRQQRNLLVRSERKAVASLYSAALAHDLNNLLMGFSGLLEVLKQEDRQEDDLSQLGRSLEHAIQRLAPFAKRLAASAKNRPSGSCVSVELPTALSQNLDMLRKHPDVRLCTLEIGRIPPVTLRLDGELFEQALSNLVINAAQAAGHAGKISVAAVSYERSVAIEVHDSGPGIAPEIAELIFDPGYTTRESGIGLGLLTVQAFAASCRASIEVRRSPLGGALFRIAIPLDQEPDATLAETSQGPVTQARI